MIKFILAALLVSLVIAAGVVYGVEYGVIDKQPSFYVPTLVLVAFVTIVIYGYLYRLKSPDAFTQFYLLLMVVKVFAFLAYNIVIVLKSKENAAYNVIFFLITYFLFTGLEIAFLYFHVSSRRDDS
ncbi:MAG TPA: hypothetical protein VD927_16095 [Chryseosolibacter sp.]|nr:hypothetical protein [Chryseosolibacter sp.]